ncbi:hypothetical protein [Aestuariimicrobium kwangyangense]|uniref:hypothetical protein n=1 Tax=Aestuariimicrobium kwangyangense TaxID=396389 RepID=UPI0003B4F367|nr:hypothetical protein [Aestuariimicrobium kwangyangense]
MSESTPAATDLSVFLEWWADLSDDTFVALPPPAPHGRHTQADLHSDADRAITAAGLAPTTAYAGWQWQSQERAFDADGALQERLFLHWGGDPQVVHQHLATAPQEFTVTAARTGAAFEIDKRAHLGDDGLADPDDPVAVRQLMERLLTPIDHTARPLQFGPLTPPEEAWLFARWEESPDIEQAAPFVRALAMRQRLDEHLLSSLVAEWLDLEHPAEWGAWRAVLVALLRQGHPAATTMILRLGVLADPVLAEVPTPGAVGALREHALAQPVDLTPWLHSERVLSQVDLVDAALNLWHDLVGAGLAEQRASALAEALLTLTPPPFKALKVATDERLPLAVRRGVAQTAKESLAHAEEHHPDLVRRFREQADDLLEGTGPDLTGTETELAARYDDYRHLQPSQESWLRSQLVRPGIDLQGLGFCLDILVSHGRGTAADVDTLAAGWRKRLAKNYDAPAGEWRHPLVTLTVLARELHHPLRGDLETFWLRAATGWARRLAPLVLVGDPSVEGLRKLWDVAVASDDASNLWRSWLLARSRLTSVTPVALGDVALREAPLRHPQQVADAIIATVVPELPLWGRTFSTSDPAWLDRGLLVLEHPDLTPAVREHVVRTVARHLVLDRAGRTEQPPSLTAAQLSAFRDRWQAAQPTPTRRPGLWARLVGH